MTDDQREILRLVLDRLGTGLRQIADGDRQAAVATVTRAQTEVRSVLGELSSAMMKTPTELTKGDHQDDTG